MYIISCFLAKITFSLFPCSSRNCKINAHYDTSAAGQKRFWCKLLKHGFIAATIFGCDLGPNLTTVGSLATVLWLLILRQRNVDVSGLDYFKVGVVVTPLMLLAGALTMWSLL